MKKSKFILIGKNKENKLRIECFKGLQYLNAYIKKNGFKAESVIQVRF